MSGTPRDQAFEDALALARYPRTASPQSMRTIGGFYSGVIYNHPWRWTAVLIFQCRHEHKGAKDAKACAAKELARG